MTWKKIESAPLADNFSCIIHSDGSVGEATYHDTDGQSEWWWANTHGEYHSEPIFPTPDLWQPLPDLPTR